MARADPPTPPPDAAADLAEVRLLDLDGSVVRLGDTWQAQPAVLAFLRHYG